MKYAVETGTGDMINVPSFMKIGKGVQAILRFGLRNLRECNVRITNGSDL
jgi:hypothetical protein